MWKQTYHYYQPAGIVPASVHQATCAVQPSHVSVKPVKVSASSQTTCAVQPSQVSARPAKISASSPSFDLLLHGKVFQYRASEENSYEDLYGRQKDVITTSTFYVSFAASPNGYMAMIGGMTSSYTDGRRVSIPVVFPEDVSTWHEWTKRSLTVRCKDTPKDGEPFFIDFESDVSALLKCRVSGMVKNGRLHANQITCNDKVYTLIEPDKKGEWSRTYLQADLTAQLPSELDEALAPQTWPADMPPQIWASSD